MGEYTDRLRQQELESQQNDVTKWLLPFAAGLGAVALGSYIYKNSFAGQGGNVVANLLHFLGRPNQIGVNVEKVANSGAAVSNTGVSGLRSWLSSTFNLGISKVQLGPIDIVKDLTNIIEILGSTSREDVRERVRDKVTEYINRKYTNAGVGASYFSQNLERVTVDQVLGNKGQWSKVIGENQFTVLQKSRDLGILSGEHILDKNIFVTNKGFVRDTRLRSIFLKPDEHGNLVSKLDFFGQWNVFKSLIGENTGVARLTNPKGVKGRGYFIDGNVYAYAKDMDGNVVEHVIARNKKLREVGDRLAPITAARNNLIEPVIKQRSGFFGNIISAFERKTGIGTSFQNRYTIAQRWIFNPIKRLRAISSGEAVVRKTTTEKSEGHFMFLDEMVGAGMPEIVSNRPKVTKYVGGVVDFSSLTTHQKLSLIFDRSLSHSLVKRSESEKIQASVTSGIKTRLKKENYFTPPPPEGGFKIKGPTHGYYVADKSSIIPGITSTRDFANYLVYRVSHLASESLLGISFLPAKSILGNTARLAAIPLIYEGIHQAYNYADYLSEKYTGFSPTKTAATIYTKLRVAQQQMRELLGIQQVAKSAEENFPGLVNSGLSSIGRSMVAPAAAFGIGSKGSIGLGVTAAAVAYALIGGPSPEQTSENLQKEYAGDVKVPIRKGRFWGIGTMPWEGGEIERFDYSWYTKVMDDPRTKSLYGSQEEYWKYHANVFGVPFPTPSNYFGLNNLFNPYRLDKMHASDRPYEETRSQLEEFPIFGPILGSTIGKIFKPTIYRAGLVPEGLNTGTARDLGMPDVVASKDAIDSLVDRMKKIGNVALEPIGLYKFVLEYFGVKLEPDTEQVATSDTMQSAARRFYGLGLGGMLGETEFIRRFMLSDYGTTSNINNMLNRVPNSSPDWLPGTNSRFKRDNSYFIDFHKGDPFVKVTGGEWRLPGAGYESINQLESGKPGEYSPVDRFLILSDVAPWSDAYRFYERQVSKMSLTPEWAEKVRLAKEYKEKSTTIENRYPRYADSLISLNEHIHDSASYKEARQTYDRFTHDFLAEIPILGSKLAPFRDPYEKYRKMYVEGSEFASWYTPWEDIQRPTIYDIALSNPVMGAVKGGVLGGLLSTPFLSWASPVAAAPVRSLLGGAILGGGLATARIAAGLPSNYVPPHIVEQSRTTEYLDAVAYTKNRALEELANSQGLDSTEFRKARKKTLIGANTPIMLRASLPTSTDKRYFDVFMKTPEANRDQILSSVAPHMAHALAKAWDSDYNTTETADQEAYTKTSEIGLPGYNSLAWHPSVDNKSMQLKLIMHGLGGVSDNYHRYGFYESHEAILKTRLPDLWNETTTFTPPPDYYSGPEYMKEIGQNIYEQQSSYSSIFSTPYGARYTKRLQIDRSQDVMNVVRGRY